MRIASWSLILLSLSFGKLLAQDTTCGIAWGPILNISGTNPNAFSPKIAAQGDTLHATWFGGGFRLPYTRSTNNGLTWEEPREMLTDSITFPDEANDPWVLANNHAIFLFFTFSVMTGKPHMMKSTNGGTTWSAPFPITQVPSGRIYFASILGDTVFVHGPQWNNAMMYTTNGGLNWDTIATRLTGRGANGVAITKEAIHNTYDDISNAHTLKELAYKRSTDLGVSWSDSLFLSSLDNEFSDQPALGVIPRESSSQIFTTWRDGKYGYGTLVGGSIIMRKSIDAGITFQPETLLTAPGQPVGYNQDRSGQQISSFDNTVLITWTNDLSGHINMRYSVDAGDTWSELCDVSPTRLAVEPASVVTPTSINVIFNGPDNGCHTCWGIYYRRGIILETSISEAKHNPAGFGLLQNYPNPFNPSTTIQFRIEEPGFTTLKVFDILGQEVAVLLNEKKDAGEYSVEWDAGGRATGMYVYRLTQTKSTTAISNQTKAMIYLK